MRIRVKVTPGAKQPSIQKECDLLTGEDIYMVKLSAKPVDGAANKALIDALAEYFCVPRRKVHIVQGGTSRWKVLDIDR